MSLQTCYLKQIEHLVQAFLWVFRENHHCHLRLHDAGLWSIFCVESANNPNRIGLECGWCWVLNANDLQPIFSRVDDVEIDGFRAACWSCCFHILKFDNRWKFTSADEKGRARAALNADCSLASASLFVRSRGVNDWRSFASSMTNSRCAWLSWFGPNLLIWGEWINGWSKELENQTNPSDF